MKFLILLALFTFTFSFTLHAEEKATPTTEVISLATKDVTELLSYITQEKVGKAPLFWKKEPQFSSENEFCYQSVIVVGKERMTLQYFPDKNTELAFLAIWWREDGTTSRDSVSFASIMLDGKIVSASGHKRDKRFVSDYHPIGLEHEAYWQSVVNFKVRSALDFYRKK